MGWCTTGLGGCCGEGGGVNIFFRAEMSTKQGVSSLLEIPTDSCHFFCTPGNPCVTPIVTRGEGSFRYQGVSTRGVRHSPDFCRLGSPNLLLTSRK